MVNRSYRMKIANGTSQRDINKLSIIFSNTTRQFCKNKYEYILKLNYTYSLLVCVCVGGEGYRIKKTD